MTIDNQITQFMDNMLVNEIEELKKLAKNYDRVHFDKVVQRVINMDPSKLEIQDFWPKEFLSIVDTRLIKTLVEQVEAYKCYKNELKNSHQAIGYFPEILNPEVLKGEINFMANVANKNSPYLANFIYTALIREVTNALTTND